MVDVAIAAFTALKDGFVNGSSSLETAIEEAVECMEDLED
jgi:hypothetical protein